jgi:Rad3-related DNA helicase
MVSEDKVLKIARKRFGPDFVFREGQMEVILDILQVFFEGEKNLYLLDAPTGSGKSIIALVFADVLNDYNLRGYILTSDLSLFDQYERDLRKFFPHFGSLKGADNYTCAVNSERFSLGDCRLKNISYEAAEDLLCFQECGYLRNRKRAIKADTTVTTYSYWLIQRNYVEGRMQDRGKGVPFPKRDFTICDEAHKVSEIVQNHFSPRISPEMITKAQELSSFLKRKGMISPRSTSSVLKHHIEKALKETNDARLFSILKDLEIILLEYVKCGNAMKDHCESAFAGGILVPKDWRFALSMADWFKDAHCKFEDYNHIISQVSPEYMIKNPQGGNSVVFNCLEESYMMNKYFHSQAGFKLLMTATMGDPVDFMKSIGAKRCKYKRMDSTFDFTRSPVFFYPDKRMSMNQKDQNFDWMKNKVVEIAEKHPDENGIVHSGSYELTIKLLNNLPDEIKNRFVYYTNSQEKEKAIIEFTSQPGKILIGPSLLEGIDLFEERSRFQIFLKVPFPSLGDKFVSAKMTYQPEWYDWKTCIQIIQGVGRSVRSQKDWAVTYFLDGCLSDLFRRRRNAFPPEFQRRIKIIKEI